MTTMVDLAITLLEDEGFGDRFCADCDACHKEYGSLVCPVDFDMSDTNCARHEKWLDIQAKTRGLQGEIEDMTAGYPARRDRRVA